MRTFYSCLPILLFILGLGFMLSGGNQILDAIGQDKWKATPGALTAIAGAIVLLAAAIAVRQTPRE